MRSTSDSSAFGSTPTCGSNGVECLCRRPIELMAAPGALLKERREAQFSSFIEAGGIHNQSAALWILIAK